MTGSELLMRLRMPQPLYRMGVTCSCMKKSLASLWTVVPKRKYDSAVNEEAESVGV
jgi:hypothetical protein